MKGASRKPGDADQRTKEANFLAHKKGLSTADIARRVGVNARTVRRYLATGLFVADAKKTIEHAQPSKTALNEFFGIRGEHAHIETIRNSDPCYFDALLRTFTTTQRRTFSLFFYDNMSVADISQLEKVSDDAIERRLERIKRRFHSVGLPFPVRRTLPRECRGWVDLNAM